MLEKCWVCRTNEDSETLVFRRPPRKRNFFEMDYSGEGYFWSHSFNEAVDRFPRTVKDCTVGKVRVMRRLLLNNEVFYI